MAPSQRRNSVLCRFWGITGGFMLEQFATNNEAVIILFGFLLEIVLSTAMLAILVLEYFYDKKLRSLNLSIVNEVSE